VVGILKDYLIGTGGWAYFRVPGLNPLTAYSRVFSFVEVNSTFYNIPLREEVEKWRKIVPPDFRFSVRAHQSITHKYKLRPTRENIEMIADMKQICDTLKSEILHLQTPATLKPTPAFIKDLRDLLGSADTGKLRLALETRAANPRGLPSELVKTMQEHNMVHSVDLSRGEIPAYESDTLYTRLFGKGKHNVYQPTDEELVQIDNKALASKSGRVVMSFHFVRMYKDAARLKTYKQTGKFPNITRSTGLASLEEVLREDAPFPTTKQDLMQGQGWKLFDLTKTEKAHAKDLLMRLPEKTYHDVSEITATLRSSSEEHA
jgi:uncharacterized protein YecE (DUF72 family)